MQELLDKFNRDRWVEVLTEISKLDVVFTVEELATLEEVIEYLKGKPVV